MADHSFPPRASLVHLPQGSWSTVLDCLCSRFPNIDRATWLDRIHRGRVLNAQDKPLSADEPYQAGLQVRYFREVPEEVSIPFQEQVLYVDEHLVVVDKPHFLPVQPAGRYVNETLLGRLSRYFNSTDLTPLHRIDRLTAGLVLFSCNPATRGAYQALFRERRMAKTYEALAPALPKLAFPQTVRSRIVSATEPFFLMEEVAGQANSETYIEVLEQRQTLWRYLLKPITGRKHQLRVQMAGLGAGICHDPFYPQLQARQERESDDYGRPLKLLAQKLAFTDPLTGVPRSFCSQLQLEWP